MAYTVKRNRKGKIDYLVRYRGLDRKLHSKSFRRRVDADNYLKTILADVVRGDWIDPRKAKVPFGEIAAEWQASRRTLRPGTIARQDSALKVHVLPRFASVGVGEVTWEAIETLRDDLLTLGRSPAHTTKVLEVLGQILKLALKKRLILSNPMDLVKGPGSEPQKEIVFLQPSALNDLAGAIDPRYRAMVLLSGYRGLRFGEAAGLKTSRLNLLQATLDIREILVEVKGSLSFGPPKTKESIRAIRLPRFLIDVLNEHLLDFPPKTDLVFANPDGTPLRRSNFSRRTWKPALKRVEVPDGLTFHGLRHSAVSMLIAEGAQMVEIGGILGWSKNSIPRMMARYGHLYPERDEEITERIEQLYRSTAHQMRTKTAIDGNFSQGS